MKLLISLSLLLTSISYGAEKLSVFEKEKKRVSAELTKHISLLQKEKECVDKAADKKIFSACRDAARDEKAKAAKEEHVKRMAHINKLTRDLNDEKEARFKKK